MYITICILYVYSNGKSKDSLCYGVNTKYIEFMLHSLWHNGGTNAININNVFPPF